MIHKIGCNEAVSPDLHHHWCWLGEADSGCGGIAASTQFARLHLIQLNKMSPLELDSTKPDYKRYTMSSTKLLKLPTELLFHIAGFLGMNRDVSCFSQVNQQLHDTITPYLYRRYVSDGCGKVNLGWDNAVSFAVARRHIRTLKGLMDTGMNVNCLEKSGLVLSAVRGSEEHEALQILLENGANPNPVVDAESWPGMAPLAYAAKEGNFEAVKLLVKHGADLNFVAGKGYKALSECIREGVGIEILQYLIEQGADLEAGNSCTKALSVAVARNCLDAARLLLQSGANVHVWTKMETSHFPSNYDIAERKWSMSTLLHAALDTRNIEMIELLFDFGASLKNDVRDVGERMMEFAAQQGSLSVVKVLLDGGTRTSMKETFTRATLLHMAAEAGNIEVIALLADRAKMDIDCEDWFCFRPVHYAIGNDKVVEWFVARGFTIKVSDPEKISQIKRAIAWGNTFAERAKRVLASCAK